MAAKPGMDASMPMEMKPLPEATTVPADMTLHVAPFTVTAQ